MKKIIYISMSVITFGYFLPTTIAGMRDHKETSMIFFLNLFGFMFGVTWIIALILALKD